MEIGLDFQHHVLVSLHLKLTGGIACPSIFFHTHFSPKSASARVLSRVTPSIGHLGLTQVNGLRKDNSASEPRLG